MKFLLEFLRQKTPKPGTEMPGYFRRALEINEKLLAVLFLVCFFLVGWSTRSLNWAPVVFAAATVACLLYGRRMVPRLSMGCYAAITLVWCVWYQKYLGWTYSGHLLLLPLLMLVFFNIFDPPWFKIAVCAALFVFRMILFSRSLDSDPVYILGNTTGTVCQMVNTIVLFITLALDAILFSSSIQDTERKLRLDNQELHKEAGTDPLTQLPNRRAMIDTIERFRKASPEEPFSVAIGDIDFFKKINDTYGHNCGDYTLKTLADLFRQKGGANYTACRWGGEEFCFFMPGKNIDEAWNEMFDLCSEVKKMPLSFEGNDFSITITIGIEENDFHSSMEDILDRADKKLYMGKISGRDRVVM